MSGFKRNSRFDRTTMPPNKKQKMNDIMDDDVDPLDAFMAGINKKTNKQRKDAIMKQKKYANKSEREYEKMTRKEENKGNKKLTLDTYDPMNEFIDQMKRKNDFIPSNQTKGDGYNSDEEVYRYQKYADKVDEEKREITRKLQRKEMALKYDDYGNIITPDRDRLIEHLPAIDHSKVYYTKFNKMFYKEHTDITNMTDTQLNKIKNELMIKTEGNNVPKPCISFGHFGFDDRLMDIIVEQGFSKPTAIQSQAIPCGLMGRDIIGISKTGSGKTGAFLWPIIPHILDQIETNNNPIQSGVDGPIVIILTPTRELAEQIFNECIKYIIPFGISIAQLYGGLQMHKQRLKLKKGCEMIIGTPGRIIDMIKDKSTNCYRVTSVIIDECDKMFSLGFENQLLSIIGQIRPDKQISLFSATMSPKIENLVKKVLNPDYVRIRIGEEGLGNTDVTQIVSVVKSDNEKFEWIKKRIHVLVKAGLVLIFCSSKKKCELLNKDLTNYLVTDYANNDSSNNGKISRCNCIHGGKLQGIRNDIISKYRSHKINILIATDIVARGLDIHDIKTVINYDIAGTIDSHIHRIGRTGRGDDKTGVAYTLINSNDKKDKLMAPKFVKMFKKLNMFIPIELQQMISGKIIPNNNNNNNSNNGNNNSTEIDFSSHVNKSLPHFQKQQKIKDAKDTFYKKGFSMNINDAKKSFQSTFVKSSQNKPKSRWDQR